MTPEQKLEACRQLALHMDCRQDEYAVGLALDILVITDGLGQQEAERALYRRQFGTVGEALGIA